MAQVVWTEQARQDLKDIVEYIARDSRAYAQSFALQIGEKVGGLERFPESGPVIPEDRTRRTRQITIGNYRILYRHSESEVQILAIVHGARYLGPPA